MFCQTYSTFTFVWSLKFLCIKVIVELLSKFWIIRSLLILIISLIKTLLYIVPFLTLEVKAYLNMHVYWFLGYPSNFSSTCTHASLKRLYKNLVKNWDRGLWHVKQIMYKCGGVFISQNEVIGRSIQHFHAWSQLEPQYVIINVDEIERSFLLIINESADFLPR